MSHHPLSHLTALRPWARLGLAGALSIAALPGAALAQTLIEDTVATARTTANAPDEPSGHPMRAVDRSGYDAATGAHAAGTWPHSWVSGNQGRSTNLDEWYRVDLGGSYDLSQVVIYNGNEPGYGVLPLRRIVQADLYVSADDAPGPVPTDNADGNGWTLVRADARFTQASGRADYGADPAFAMPDAFDLTGHTARHFALKIDSQGGRDRWGVYYVQIAEVLIYGDAADQGPPDRDGDGVPDGDDAFPDDPSESADSDGDGVGDNGDAFPHDATESADSDGDGVGDNSDAFPHDPSESADSDGDGVGDNGDPCVGFPNDDTDGDRVCDSADVCPTDPDDIDDDGDTVCDVEDICVGFANVDTDGDQICDDLDLCQGNDASGDTDADGICDADDNCPVDANADQTDGDDDRIGDACEADSDADGIIDDDDNCLDMPNGDQSDLDLDGAGDPCDPDDDGDGVADLDDNCPLFANPAQSDLDGDGFGDICDGDDDGDGIADETDACPGTPVDALFDAEGCAGAQRVELACGVPEDYGLLRRGRYIACVTREAQSAGRQGLLTHRDKAQLIRRAVHDVWVSYIRQLGRCR